jgi:hypothetical protein
VLLENVFKEVVKSDRIVTQRATTFQGNPALQGEYQTATAYVRYRSVLVGTRLYQLGVFTSSPTTNVIQANLFLNSFRLATPAARTPTRPPVRPTATGASTGAWETFISAEGKFSVEMPGTPREGSQEIDLGVLGTVPMVSFAVNRVVIEYTASYIDYPASAVSGRDVSEMLQGAFAGVAGSNQIAGQELIDVQGNPGLQGEFAHPSGYAWYKAVLVENRLYQLIAIATNREASEADARRFLDSFRITDGTTTGDPTEEPTGAPAPTRAPTRGPISAPTPRPRVTPTVGTAPTSTTGTSQNPGGALATGTTESLRITIHGVKRTQGDGIFTAEEGNEYLIVDVTLENMDKEEHYVSRFYSVITDSTGAEYDPTIQLKDTAPSPEKTLAPGEQARGEMVYEVDASATGLEFVYTPTLEDPLRLKLDK